MRLFQVGECTKLSLRASGRRAYPQALPRQPAANPSDSTAECRATRLLEPFRDLEALDAGIIEHVLAGVRADPFGLLP